MKFLYIKVTFAFILSLLVTRSGYGQEISVYADGLTAPIGIEVDARGWIWVGQQGTGNNDSKVSVVTGENQVYPFLTGLPSGINATGEVTGTTHVYFNSEGKLMIVQGEGSHALSQSILFVDTTGFSPGNTTLGPEDIGEVYNLGDFTLAQPGISESNPYTLTFGPDNDLFIVDAAANAVIRRDNESGDLSIFTTFANIQNNTGIGPPSTNAVPTGIAYKDDHFFVGLLTGFPFADNAAKIYEIDQEGNTTVMQEGLTTVVDLTLDDENNIIFLQHAAFKAPPPFTPNSGMLIRHTANGLETLASGLNRPTGVRFKSESEIFVSTLTDGELLRIQIAPTNVAASNQQPETFVLKQNYPNPFNPETIIEYHLSKPGEVSLKIFNSLGQEVRSLVQREQSPGSYKVFWNGKDGTGQPAPSGVYFYRLKAGGFDAQVEKMVLMR